MREGATSSPISLSLGNVGALRGGLGEGFLCESISVDNATLLETRSGGEGGIRQQVFCIFQAIMLALKFLDGDGIIEYTACSSAHSSPHSIFVSLFSILSSPSFSLLRHESCIVISIHSMQDIK